MDILHVVIQLCAHAVSDDAFIMNNNSALLHQSRAILHSAGEGISVDEIIIGDELLLLPSLSVCNHCVTGSTVTCKQRTW